MCPEYNVAIACANTYRVCDSDPTGRCTDRVGVLQLSSAVARQLNLNSIQLAIVQRLQMSLTVSNMHSQVSTRLSGALRAPERADGLIQSSLPDNQWELEVTGWFEASLARLQYLTQEYATGPAFVPEGSSVYSPSLADDPAALAMCYSQTINDALGTSSFSILGLAIVFSIGGVIILLSLVIDTAVGWLQGLLRKGLAKKQAWLLDDKLQMQRYVFERAGLGNWLSANAVGGGAGGFPVTRSGERFRSFDPDRAPYGYGAAPPPFVGAAEAAGGAYAVPQQQQSGDGRESVPNTFGNKDSDVFVREMSDR